MTSVAKCATTIGLAFALAASAANPTFAKPARSHHAVEHDAGANGTTTITPSNIEYAPGIQHKASPNGDQCWVDTDGAGRPYGYWKSC